MLTELTSSILAIAEETNPTGISMGSLVQTMSQRGYGIEAVEQETWQLLRQRKLTITGYVRRLLRRKNSLGESTLTPVYDFLLIPWSLELDHQLDLDLEAQS